MRIKWYGHASFLIETNGVRIVTDPYNPAIVPFRPITESADIVIRSSDDDGGHNYAEMISGDPIIVTGTEITDGGVTHSGIQFNAVAVKEHSEHPTHEIPIDNSMYTIRSEDLCIGHMGDVGHELSEEQINALRDCDVLLALTGGFPTIDLDELDIAIQAINPRVILPMHYAINNVDLGMHKIDAFTKRFSPDEVQDLDNNDINITKENIQNLKKVILLEPVC